MVQEYEIIVGHALTKSFILPDVCGLRCLGGDFEKLSHALAKKRPVLIFDHRGIGQSTYSTPAEGDSITIESMARDVVDLISGIGLTKVAICGYSMGGSITQQMITLPYHSTNPTPLPFVVTHVILAATMPCPLKKGSSKYSIKIRPPPKDRSLTLKERREEIREFVANMFDPEWMNEERNSEAFEWHLNRMVTGRPFPTVMKQMRATGRFEFRPQLKQLSPSLPVMVIHGDYDRIVSPEYGEQILQLIPWARRVQVGDQPGQIPSNGFGHTWWEYFDLQVWIDVVEIFLSGGSEDPDRGSKAKL
ncbi:polyketide transferase af380 family protein [Abortiporus biennis]